VALKLFWTGSLWLDHERAGRPRSGRHDAQQSRSRIIFNLYLALGAMLVQQTFATVGRSTVPLIAAAIVTDLAVDPALVGVYLAIGSVAGFLTTLGCGGFIMRYGALRMTQVGMLALGIGLSVITTGWLPLFAAGAFIGGLGQAVSTPSSSHLLGRLSPRHLAPLVFSIKQTGVPAGLMLAGVVAPVLAVEAGWRTALLVMAGLCLLTVVALQPLRARFDVDRNPALVIVPESFGSSARRRVGPARGDGLGVPQRRPPGPGYPGPGSQPPI